jgi:hypothetical protein
MTTDPPGNDTTLTPAARARRVALARDVLGRIEAGGLTLDFGNYLLDRGTREPIPRAVAGLPHDADLRPYVDAIEAGCTVCAIGSLVLAKARLHAAVTVRDVTVREVTAGVTVTRSRQPTLYRALADSFDERTLARIEAAFDATEYAAPLPIYEAHRAALAAAADFGRQFPDPAGRCAAVMRSIVDHDGEFVVPS